MSRRIAALFLILVPVTFNLAFFALGSAFDYPDILRQPTDVILTRFAAGGDSLVTLWYLFATTALLAIPLALLLYGVFQAEHPQLSLAAAVVGSLSGLVQVMGLYRWVFLVPSLALSYTTSSDPAVQTSAAIAFDSAHRYLGMAIGEHLGYMFTASWTILLSVMVFRSTLFGGIWGNLFGILGIISAVGILAGVLEPAGWTPAGAINAIAYILWSVWLIGLGVSLLVGSFRRTA